MVDEFGHCAHLSVVARNKKAASFDARGFSLKGEIVPDKVKMIYLQLITNGARTYIVSPIVMVQVRINVL